MAKSLCESRPLKLAEADAATADGTIPVILIDAGWGSSGYYSEAVLKNAATSGVFAEGTQMFLDHPGEAEMYDRPERSVRDLVATVVSPGIYDESVKGVRANIKPMGANAIMLEDKDFLKAVGLSIRAYGEATLGEAEGRKGQILTELTECISVDFVTKAGRGGRVLVDLMESARPEQVVERAKLHGVSEASANNTRTALQAALTAEYGGERAWVWVRDFDEANVWFQYETEGSSGTYQLGYSLEADGNASVSGNPVEVMSQTTYVPITQASASDTSATEADPQLPAPAGESTATQTEESNMATIEDKELAELRESADQRAAAEQRATLAERALAERDARDAARTVIAEEAEAASITFNALETDGLLARVQLGEGNSFDSSAFREAVKKAAEGKVVESADTPTRGLLSGFGVTLDSGTSEADVKSIQAAEAAAAGAFGRKIGA